PPRAPGRATPAGRRGTRSSRPSRRRRPAQGAPACCSRRSGSAGGPRRGRARGQRPLPPPRPAVCARAATRLPCSRCGAGERRLVGAGQPGGRARTIAVAAEVVTTDRTVITPDAGVLVLYRIPVQESHALAAGF